MWSIRRRRSWSRLKVVGFWWTTPWTAVVLLHGLAGFKAFGLRRNSRFEKLDSGSSPLTTAVAVAQKTSRRRWGLLT